MATSPQPLMDRKQLSLRVFSPDPSLDNSDTPQGLSPHLTLPEVFEQYIVPVHLVERSPLTLKDHRGTLKKWVAYTANPPILQIDDFTIGLFREGLVAEGLEDNTRRKHCTNLQFCLDRLGPKIRRDMTTAELLPSARWVPKPSQVIHDVCDNFTLAEISAFIDACRVATRSPAFITAPTWWRSLAIFTYNVGPRIGSLLKLRWDWLYEDESGLWLRVPAKATKMGRGMTLYVNRHARVALEAVRPTGRDRIFAWPCKDNWLHTQRRRILAASTIPENRRFGFHAFRKACGTELARINGMAAAIQLGHSSRGNVTRDHYVHRSIVRDACEQLPQPVCHHDLAVERQMKLFD